MSGSQLEETKVAALSISEYPKRKPALLSLMAPTIYIDNTGFGLKTNDYDTKKLIVQNFFPFSPRKTNFCLLARELL